MRWIVSISLIFSFIFFFFSVDATTCSFVSEELRMLLEDSHAFSMPRYELPLFDCSDRLIGEVLGYEGKAAHYEFIFIGGQLVGIGIGDYLRNLLNVSKTMAQETLDSHFDHKAKFLESRLTYMNPVSFWVRIFYHYGDAVLHDLSLQTGSLRFTVAECGEQSGEWGTLTLGDGVSFAMDTFSWFEIQHDFPVWEYYLSSFSNAVVTLADYWKSKGFIKIPIYPSDPDFLFTNIRLMMQDVEMLRRRCGCEDTEVGVSEILEKFVNARGGSVKVVVRDKSSPEGQGESLKVHDLERILRVRNQPLLFECRGGSVSHYGIITGYFKTKEDFFVICLLPMRSINGARWERYLFKWSTARHLRIYEVFQGVVSEYER